MKPDTYLTGAWETLGGMHRVWRDMVNADANVVTVIRLRFKYNTGNSYPADVRGSLYVMHCHIVEHEDNEMMRYFSVE
jgi:FtsP/CotA-like multicopper oxidase with cupredoxin domain